MSQKLTIAATALMTLIRYQMIYQIPSTTTIHKINETIYFRFHICLFCSTKTPVLLPPQEKKEPELHGRGLSFKTQRVPMHAI